LRGIVRRFRKALMIPYQARLSSSLSVPFHGPIPEKRPHERAWNKVILA
jgi:hypothetical protein